MENKGKYYITTAIAYTSGKPHIGNTYEIVLADSIARFKRLQGYDVFFQTGTDEHGQKIELKAAVAGISPKEFVDNVAGEIKGSEAAMQYALDHKIPSIIIYHDYQGIASWCNGDWKANKPGTIAYRDFYQKAKEKVHIEFRKVKGHSNDKYNDMVDELAKEALGIH